MSGILSLPEEVMQCVGEHLARHERADACNVFCAVRAACKRFRDVLVTDALEDAALESVFFKPHWIERFPMRLEALACTYWSVHTRRLLVKILLLAKCHTTASPTESAESVFVNSVDTACRNMIDDELFTMQATNRVAEEPQVAVHIMRAISNLMQAKLHAELSQFSFSRGTTVGDWFARWSIMHDNCSLLRSLHNYVTRMHSDYTLLCELIAMEIKWVTAQMLA